MLNSAEFSVCRKVEPDQWVLFIKLILVIRTFKCSTHKYQSNQTVILLSVNCGYKPSQASHRIHLLFPPLTQTLKVCSTFHWLEEGLPDLLSYQAWNQLLSLPLSPCSPSQTPKHIQRSLRRSLKFVFALTMPVASTVIHDFSISSCMILSDAPWLDDSFWCSTQ